MRMSLNFRTLIKTIVCFQQNFLSIELISWKNIVFRFLSENTSFGIGKTNSQAFLDFKGILQSEF